MDALIPIMTHGGAAGVGALILYGLGMILRDGQHARVTTARRDESLAPALIARIEQAIDDARADAAEARELAERSREAERDCLQRVALISQRLAVVEARCEGCPGRVG